MVRSVVTSLLTVILVLVSVGSVWARDPIALGLSIDPADHRDQDMRRLDRLIEIRGVKPAIWTTWSNWGSRGANEACLPGIGRCAFPSETVAALMERDITPFIWWQPVAPPGKARGEFARYVRIIDGHHDDYITEWATAAAQHDGTILMRFAHEMNGRWYPWGITRFDNTPQRYVRAWRHIWRIFQQVGAANVKFVWSPAREDCKGCEPNYRYESFYPGNRYVDYVALNSYNSAKRRWRTLDSMLEKPLARLREVTRSANFPTGKPVILGEVASVHTGGSKALWLENGYNGVFRRWPKVKAIVYFDVDMQPRNKSHPDWRLRLPADGSALAAYERLAALPRFKGQVPPPPAAWAVRVPEPEPPVPDDPDPTATDDPDPPAPDDP